MIKQIRYKLLLKQNKDRVYSYALYMLRNKMDADDVAQEVFIRIWKNIDKFNIQAATAWIMKTTHNLCLDYLRKRKVAFNRETELNEDFADSIQEEDKMTDPEVKARQTFLKQRIKEAIENLPANLKSTFIMYEMEGMRYKEISEALEIPLNSVKVYILRARKKLQEELKVYKHEAV